MFEWTPAYFQAGEFEIPFTVSDGESITTQTTKITVLNVNAAPVFDNLSTWQIQEGQSVRFRAFAFDPDNPGFVPQDRNADGQLTINEGSDPSVTYTVSGLPTGATFDPITAMFAWTPGYANAGIYNVTFTAADDGNGTGSTKETSLIVPIAVFNSNRAPAIAEFTNITLNRGETRDLVLRVSDADNDPLVLQLKAESTGYNIPDFVKFTDNGDGTATLRLTPGVSDGGDYSFTLTAADNGNGGGVNAVQGDEYTFVVSVNAANDAPKLPFIGNKVAVVGETLKFLVKASDRNQDNLNFNLSSLPAGATLTPTAIYGEALFSWTPTLADIGTYPVTIGVQDSGNGNEAEVLTSQQAFNLVVRTSNTAPILSAIANSSVAEGQTLTFALSSSDADGDTLTYSASNLPPGAELDAAQGILSWTPTLSQAGTYNNIIVTASDGNKSSSQTFAILVNNTNQAPVLAPLPIQTGLENNLVQFTLAAGDIDNDSLIYSAVSSLPTGAAFDPRTGQFSWKPNYEQAGEYVLKFAATDAQGASDVRDVTLRVANVNRSPAISVSPHAVALGEMLQFTVAGTDPDNGTNLIYTAVDLPDGAVLNAATGQFTWIPNPGQVGDYGVTYAVSDGEKTVTQTSLLRVAVAPTAPSVNFDLTPSFPAVPGQKVIVQTLASGLAAITNLTATVDGKSVTFDTKSRIEIIPTTPGRLVVDVTTTDADGRVGHNSTVVKVRNLQDLAAPVVAFAPGLDGAVVKNVTNIIGSVSDRNLDNWVLEIADFGENVYKTLASGYGAVSDLSLAQFDPGKLENGFYQLHLRATDISDRSSSTQAIVEVNTTTKPSAYTRTETDLSFTLSPSPTPFSLVRTYSSLNSDEVGSFGNGWQLASLDTNIQTNVPLTGRESLGVYEPFRVGTRLYLTTPTGERVGFTFAPQKHTIPGLTYYTPAWVADSGVNYTLSSADAKLTLAGNRFYDLKTGHAYNPGSGEFDGADYTLSSVDSTVYHLSAAGGVTEQIGVNGTRLIYSDSGITSSTGEIVRFVKDGAGRLTQITAPDGSLVTYSYDTEGNLVSARNLASGESHRYGYSSNLLTLATGTPGTAGEAITYSATPQVSPVLADLGSAAQFTGKTISDSLGDRFTISLRDSELRSTATGTVLLGVELQGNMTLPTLLGLTPVATHQDASGSYALFAVNRAGLNLISLTNTSPTPSLPHSLSLFIAGDVNRDGLVDGVDSGLLEGAIASSNYNASYDFNRDGVINATDVQILSSNYGFTANRAPVVTSTSVLTHTDLSTSIALDKLATDSEGDRIFYRIINPVNGAVTFTPDGHSARFTPNAGYSGTASFELVADDGFSSSAPAKVTVNVSNAALVNLDFARRGLRLDAGGSTELVVVGDFADQQDVILPYDYLQLASDNSAVATVSAGKVTGLSDGVSVLSASHNGIQAVTALRVGELLPTNQTQLNVAIAEQEGLDLYPEAVMLTIGATRQLLVGLYGVEESPDLKFQDAGTRYYLSNPGILQIGKDGLITALNEGITNVTVIYGAAEAIVPVRVETPHLGETKLGINGGVIQFGDGANRSLLMLSQGALLEDTNVNFTLKNQKEDLSLPVPGGFEFVGGFTLDIGDNNLLIPAQVAIPAPANLPVGAEVYLMRKGSMPDATGTWQPMWILEESAKVTADGMIRTQSPPYPGVTQPGEYAAFYSGVTGSGSIVKGKVSLEYKFPPAFYGLLIPPPLPDINVGEIGFGIALATFPNSKNKIIKELGGVLKILKAPLETVNKITELVEKAQTLAEVGAALSEGHIDAEVLKKISEVLKPYSAFGQLLNPDLFVSIPAFRVSYDISSINIVQVPTVGLPVVTSANVQLNPDGTASFETRLNLPAPTTTDPSTPPVLQKAELKFENHEPVVILTGSNFIVPYATANNSNTRFEDLVVNFRVGDATYQGTVLSGQDLGNNQFEIKVKPSNKIALGTAQISITRPQQERFGTEQTSYQTINYDSNPIRLSANNGYILAAEPFSDKVAVLQGTNPEAIVAATGSNDLLVARIPVGTPDVVDRPRDIAFTKDGSRAYVTLENSGRIALIDPLLLQQIDTKPETEEIDSIILPTAASPRAIVVNNQDQYAYIADGRLGVIYVLDINPNSQTYHQVIQNIQVDSAPGGLRQLAISSDGRKLFATAPSTNSATKSKIIVVNIDPKDKPNPNQNNLLSWHKQIATIDAEQGAEGLATTVDPHFITFTSRNSDATDYGVLEITNDDPLHFAATTRYTQLNLGSIYDYFDVNEAVAITISKDKKYGFIAGYNGSKFGSGIESIDGVQAGSNIGIIKDPLGENPQLFAATRPIPLGLVTDLALSNDDKYLYASYPLGGGVYVFDVEEMIKTLEHPTDYIIDQFGRPQGSRFFESLYQRPANILDFAAVPIDDINPKISIAADYGIIAEDRVRNQFTYGVSEGSTSAPVNVGITRNLAVSPPDLLKLTSPNGIKEGDLTPTFTWDFQIPDEQINEVNLFVSTFAEGKGLLPWDKVVDLSDSSFLPELNQQQKQQLLTKSWDEYDDFNPGRIVTATWKRETNTWYWHDGTTVVAQPTHDPENNNTRFTLPDITTLTAGQNYNWAVQAVSSTGQSELEFGKFNTITPLSTNPFSSVTVLTHGFTLFPSNTGIPNNFYDLADKIASTNGNSAEEKGLILRYDKPTGLWVPVDKEQRVLNLTGGLNPGDENYLMTLANNIKSVYVNQNKALVLLPEWSKNGESIQSNSGFTEAAADALFASIVQLDQALGGDVGEHDAAGNLVKLYDDKGGLIRTQGDILNSPLHFIGFSRGTVVNSEIIQRLGTYFPFAGGEVNADGTPVVDGNGKAVRDLQMTTIDPHDFYQESLKVDLAIPGTPIIKDFRDFNEPQVQVWKNITFADNYYQTVADPNGSTWTPNGRSIDGADIDIQLNGRTGFTSDDRKGSPHGNAFSWYAGTADLAIDEVDNGYTRKARPVYDQLGDKDIQELLNSNNVKLASWYPLPENQGSTEGIGTGWFYSVLGGGKDLRPTVDMSKRVSVSFDNTDEDVAKGDFAVSTLFDGNFDAITAKIDSQTIPGWSLHNDKNDTFQLPLVDWTNITSLKQPNIIVDYQRDVNGKLLDSNGNIVEYLNIESLKDALIANGYTEDGDKLKNRDGNTVEGFEANSLVEDLYRLGYYKITNTNGTLLRNGVPVVGIDIYLLATDLEVLGYKKDTNANLIDKNGNIVIDQGAIDSLREALAVPIRKSYLQRLGIDSNSPTNYALELKPNDILTHNRFVVPDWGALRFYLHVQDPESGTDPQNSVVRVFLDDYELQSSAFQGLTLEQRQLNGNPNTANDEYPGVDLREFNPRSSTSLQFTPFIAEGQSNRIGFAKQGFQTFQVDIPNELRGKVTTLRFEVSGDKTVYLDNVFFKSQHLLFGNPTLNGQEARKNIDTPEFSTNYSPITEFEIPPFSNFSNNYLIEKPQYSLSYNNNLKIPNWVSYQLNKSWLGVENNRPGRFQEDPQLPFNNRTKDGDFKSSGYSRGHMARAADRNRNNQDYLATFLTSNIIPQPINTNKRWGGLEDYLTYLVTGV